ncbi:hypothetical protein EC973_003291 [Apophysomyces ossiformis]|uniref:Uncharacterized protein n=1 Tax=Apophysomyces ossiformis TaxID=679940 RepID=A0A8H7BZH3_9FUNG|nr:hypothetical protein EC973_003291 [Apophysomyces ossiformis]
MSKHFPLQETMYCLEYTLFTPIVKIVVYGLIFTGGLTQIVPVNLFRRKWLIDGRDHPPSNTSDLLQSGSSDLASEGTGLPGSTESSGQQQSISSDDLAPWASAPSSISVSMVESGSVPADGTPSPNQSSILDTPEEPLFAGISNPSVHRDNSLKPNYDWFHQVEVLHDTYCMKPANILDLIALLSYWIDILLMTRCQKSWPLFQAAITTSCTYSRDDLTQSAFANQKKERLLDGKYIFNENSSRNGNEDASRYSRNPFYGWYHKIKAFVASTSFLYGGCAIVAANMLVMMLYTSNMKQEEIEVLGKVSRP